MNFQYKMRDSSGKIISGCEEAASRTSLVKGLEARGFQPIVVIPVPTAAAEPAKKEERRRPFDRRRRPRQNWRDITIGKAVKDVEILMFGRDLLSVVHSGLPIVSGLTDIISQIKNRNFKRVLHTVCDDVNGGVKLSEAFEKHPKIFSEFFVESVRAGEEGGRLDEVLTRLTRTMERDIETSLTIRNSVRYPVIVLCFLGLAFAMMITFVIPRIAGMFAKFDTPLPLPTKFLIALGSFFQNYGPEVLVLGLAAIIGVGIFKRTSGGKFLWDAMKLKLPVFGGLNQRLALQKFANNLQTLYASGVVLPTALEVSSKTCGNVVITEAVRKAADELRRGKSLSEAISGNDLFPPLVVRMVLMGEKTGSLDRMLGEIIQHYEREIGYMTKSLTTLIEPLLTVALGLMILVFALGVFMPLWNLMRLFRH